MAQRPLPPPGELYDVGGFKLHMISRGEGSPTVVFESGLTDDSLGWDLVQPEIAKVTRTISYDRAGTGWSERSPNPVRRRETISEELSALLEAAEVDGPLVLVGWSVGGIYIRYFAQQYPDRVAGMVLVDSSHENQRNRLPDNIRAIFDKDWNKRKERIREYAEMTHEEMVQAFSKFSLWDNYSEQTRQLAFDRLRPEVMETFLGVISDQTDFELGADALVPLGELPMIVLRAIKPNAGLLSDEQHQIMVDLEKALTEELAALSRDSQIITVESTHAIQDDEPQMVIDAVVKMVEKVRAKGGS